MRQRVVRDLEGVAVAARNGNVGLVLLDRPDVALRAQPRRLQPDRAGAGADVPHPAVGAQLQPRQRYRTHLLLGDQAFVGLPLP